MNHLIFVLWGFAFGIPFLAVNSFAARVALSAGLAVLMGSVLAESAFHGRGWFLSYYMAFLIAVGSLCAASMKVLWRSLVTRLRQTKQEKSAR
jgi:hypothetical protein